MRNSVQQDNFALSIEDVIAVGPLPEDYPPVGEKSPVAF
jgi:hypothetical protein